MTMPERDKGGGALRGLAPLDTPGARYLVLGSFPSAVSLEKSEYYGHPRNHFWLLMANIAASIGEADEGVAERDEGFAERTEGQGVGGDRGGMKPDLAEAPKDWSARVDLAARLGLAIWDLVASCDRDGSLDAAIRRAVLNDVEGFVASRRSIGLVLLNGVTAATFFARRFAPGSGLDSSNVGEAKTIRFGGRELLACRLPSTSPVPTRRFRSAADKLSAWEAGFLHLDPVSRLDKRG